MVGIKDSNKMPRCCNSCGRWRFNIDDKPICDLTYKYIENIYKRPVDCPLVEDKISAEIGELYSYVEFNEDLKTSFNMVRLEEVQRVIDKYKAESEEVNDRTRDN